MEPSKREANPLEQLLRIRAGEGHVAFWSFLTFFCILGGYFVIRPLRETLATGLGMESVPRLFTATFVSMIAVIPVYSWLVSRWSRAVLIPWLYRFFILNLLGFAAVFAWGSHALQVHASKVFFVWLSVFNLFAVSIFWSVMAEGFDRARATRLFGPIAAGGSLGAVAGSALTGFLAADASSAQLLLMTAIALEIAVWGFARIRSASARLSEVPAETTEKGPIASESVPAARADVRPVGGDPFAGFVATVRSPLLLGICLFVGLGTLIATIAYNAQLVVVGESIEDPKLRREFFAQVNFWTNVATLVVQALVISRVIERLGARWALAIVPGTNLLGIGALAFAPVLAVTAPYEVLRRVAAYAVGKPTKDLLFTGVPLEDKYKAKSFIDMVVYRGGDVIGAWSYRGLTVLGLSLTGIALAVVPVVILWGAAAWLLGRRADRAAA